MNKVYPKAVEKFMASFFDPTVEAPSETPVVKAYAVTTDYTYSDSHVDATDIEAEWVIAESKTFSGITVVDGVFDLDDMLDAFEHADLTYIGETQVELKAFIWIASWDSESRLLFYMDTWDGMELPLAFAGLVNFEWPANGIWKLGV